MVLPGGYNASLCSSHMGLMVDPGQLPSCNITALMREVPLYKRYNILELSPEQSRMCDLLNTTSSFQEFEKKLVKFKMDDNAKFWASMCYIQEFKKKLADLKAKAQCVFVQSKPCRVGWISWTSEDIKCVLDALKGTGIYEPIQDKRKGDGSAVGSGPELLSQSGGAEPSGGQSGPSESTGKDLPAAPPGIQQREYRINEPIQDKRKGDGDPKPGRKLLSQSGEDPRLEVSDGPASGGLTTLDCKARGFSTPDVALVWLRDGEPRPQETRQEEPLPSADGTFKTGATIDIDPNPADKYTCRVERPSLPGGLSKDWEPKSNAQPSVGVSVLLIVGVWVGLLVAGTLL